MAARTAHLLALAAVSTLPALAVPGPASAAEPPKCEDEVWSRPGLERSLELYCWRTDRVRIARMPAHGSVTGDHFDGLNFHFRLATEASAPQSDEFSLDLDGPAGPATQTVAVHNVPLDQNTPPNCDPVTTASRSDGTTPVEVSFYASCWDSERDDVTLEGSGPGQFLNTPFLLRGGQASSAVPQLRYRTAVSVGPEMAKYWATDSQGARSRDAPVSLQVGPIVDRPPSCRPNPALYEYNPVLHFPVYYRPGATRRFGVICEDADGDALEPRVAIPPLFGGITRFAPGPAQTGWWGLERFVDVAYEPMSDREGEDKVGVLASGPRGVGEVADIRLTTHAPPINYGGGCGWSGGSTTPNEPVTVEAWCSDDEGDPLSASIVDPPAHGSADPPVVEPVRYGDTSIKVRYTPNRDFQGVDYVTVRIDDGHGRSDDVDFEIGVSRPEPPPPPVQYTPGADEEGWFWSPAGWERRWENPPPAQGQARALEPAAQARRALRARSVRLARRMGIASVYVRATPPRATARVRALAVACAVPCNVLSHGKLASTRSASATRIKVVPGRARAVILRLSSAARKLARRRHGARAVFRLTTRPVIGAPGSARVVVRVRG